MRFTFILAAGDAAKRHSEVLPSTRTRPTPQSQVPLGLRVSNLLDEIGDQWYGQYNTARTLT